MIKLLKGLFQKKHRTGVLPDTRSAYEKSKDYKHEERAVAGSPLYGPKMLETPYPVENQHWTYSCVPHAVTLALGGEIALNGGQFTRLSKMMPYRLRSNFPNGGSHPPEIFKYLRNIGSCLYDTLPNKETEEEANKVMVTQEMFEEAKTYKGLEYYTFDDPTNFDEIVKVVSDGHFVPITFYSTYREWAQLYPDTLDNTSHAFAPVRHEVCILPKSAFIEDGKKYVVIQDSAWFGGFHLRYVSEDFIRARCYGAGYWLRVKVGTSPKPQVSFSAPLIQGMRGNAVKDLQKVLNYEAMLPDDLITGYYGARTRAAVKAFQEKYRKEILDPLGLTEGTGQVYSATIRQLNKLYGR